MDKKKLYILAGLSGLITTTLLVLYIVKKRRRREIIVKGEYVVPPNIPNRADALHSFESRKSDGFGGKMSTKIKKAMVDMYKRGVNPDVSDIKINVDSKKYKVTWEAKVKPSKDGKAYTGITTRGSAGSDADSRALGQIEQMKKDVGGKDYKLVLDFKNPKGVYIRQFFYKYTKPNEFPAH